MKKRSWSPIVIGIAMALGAGSFEADARPPDAGSPHPSARPPGRPHLLLEALEPRTFLGLGVTEISSELRAHFGAPKENGVMVSHVAADSPAARAGIQLGDVITRIDGQPVESFWELAGIIGGKKKGDKVAVDLVRDRSERKVTATLDERDKDAGSLLEKKKTIVIRDGEGPDRTMVLGDDFFPPEGFHKMERYFESPEWKARLESVDDCDRMRKRLEALEERLKVLERNLPGK
jgi:hypothetical protein